ncbi:hypothetical protein ABZT26_25905 [Streptomyces sp. NPDC005395]|uniref:hypothetical protein n=1 Tax=Streptomyces sp. NPDC005395 TaxID=3157042 RepID=UPI0033B059E9
MSSRRGRGGRERSLKDLMGQMAANKGGAATAVAEEPPPAEPVDDTWPPAEPADDVTTTADTAPNLSVVPEPREEEQPAAEAAPAPETETPSAAAPEPEPAAETEPVDAEVVEDAPSSEPEPEPAAEADGTEPDVVDGEVVAEEHHEQPDPTDAGPTAEVVATGQVLVLRGSGGESELETQRKRLLPKLPEMVPPSADLAPAQQLAYYEDILSGANRNLGLVVDLAKREWVRYVGWSLGPVRDKELWNQDPDREFKNFDAYCHEQWGFSGDYANKQIRALPVINVLRDVTAKELKEGPLRVLVRVYSSHGDQAVLDTWYRAETEYQSTAATKLEQAARDLGFIKAGEKTEADDETEKDPAIAPKLTPKERAEAWLKPLGDSVATEDPKDLAATLREVRRLVDRFDAQLKERQTEERRKAREAKKAEKPADPQTEAETPTEDSEE